MYFDKADNLYRLSVGFDDGDVLYDNCVVYPRDVEVVMGQFTLEPFDSLYGRFIAFELKVSDELTARAKETWMSIVSKVKDLETKSLDEGSPYAVYIREVNSYKTLISTIEGDGGFVDYSQVLREFFVRLEKAESARRHMRGAVGKTLSA